MSKEFNKHKKSDGIKWIAVAISVLLLAIAILAIVTSGFKDWDYKHWFAKPTQSVLDVDNCKSNNVYSSNFVMSEFADSSALLPPDDWSAVAEDTAFNVSIVDSSFGTMFEFSIRKVSLFNDFSTRSLYLFNYGHRDGFNYLVSLPPLDYSNLPSVVTFQIPIYSVIEPTTSFFTNNFYVGGVSPATNRFYRSALISLDTSKLINPVTTPTAPSKEGYHFIGWYLDNLFTIPYAGTPITSDIAFYAKYELNRHTVTFDSAGGNACSSLIVDWGSVITLPEVTRNGYDFLGWFLSDGVRYTNQVITSDTVLTAKWQIKTFTVTFDSAGGSVCNSLIVDWGSVVTLPETSYIHYNFLGWFLSDGVRYTNQLITSNTVLTAKWQIKVFKVTFDSLGGSDCGFVTVNWNNTITVPETTLTGYDFMWWCLPDGTRYTNQLFTSDTVLTAKWQIKAFTVTFYVDNKVYKTLTVNYGQKLVDAVDNAKLNFNIKSVTQADGNSIDSALNDIVITSDTCAYADIKSGAQKTLTNLPKLLIVFAFGVCIIAFLCCIPAIVKSKKHRNV